jgi:hypothetical protein
LSKVYTPYTYKKEMGDEKAREDATVRASISARLV